ncbi:tRNA (adenosine(37)-N6)-dimethylallyltransferase MiaA [Candidatus Campbellbacteria bacterium CG22_combo_CG10-13_8_21_14_all_36_13]|uniref:tRNA dimethylallyltransferase n=1 Tax=Candidatus Campbellbacteria bacterium CG22_combo_CG10-13_8_21_14_all_36_13 TaxID=1974529 RepID=A0A2H0DZP4_9BACT|nr:MAG: tRNA (adenosine(37)-N6)-dimethylallyltransferase MiaA [Candidatus Campbellbacteria bacterium CG22_combo_CG10-13_8_21_14_all_36_13]
MSSKPKVIVIVGPTASGKSDLGVEIALLNNGEIVSADSRQVYAGLDIGSGKITEEEMRGVTHHMLDMADPMDKYSVSDFKFEAELVLRDILKREKLPIVVGGTFYYIDALVYGIDFPEVPPNESLRKEIEEKSLEELLGILDTKDPSRGESVDRKNKRRVIRALEIIDVLGVVPPNTKESNYDVLWIGIDTDDSLRDRIKKRLYSRMKDGMIAEVKNLLLSGVTNQRLEEFGLEYRYIARFLKGDITKDKMENEIINKSWQYSRRQLTWLRGNKNINWFKLEEKNKIFQLIDQFLKS